MKRFLTLNTDFLFVCVCFVAVIFAANVIIIYLKMFLFSAVHSRPVVPEDKMPPVSGLMVEFG